MVIKILFLLIILIQQIPIEKPYEIDKGLIEEFEQLKNNPKAIKFERGGLPNPVEWSYEKINVLKLKVYLTFEKKSEDELIVVKDAQVGVEGQHEITIFYFNKGKLIIYNAHYGGYYGISKGGNELDFINKFNPKELKIGFLKNMTYGEFIEINKNDIPTGREIFLKYITFPFEEYGYKYF